MELDDIQATRKNLIAKLDQLERGLNKSGDLLSRKEREDQARLREHIGKVKRKLDSLTVDYIEKLDGRVYPPRTIHLFYNHWN
jgi:hypothetical protein